MTNSLYNNEKVKWTLYDLSMALMIIGLLAFGDTDVICLGFQALAFAYTGLVVIRKRCLENWIFRIVAWIILLSFYMFISSLWANTNNKTVVSTSIAFVQFGIILFCLLIYLSNVNRVHKLFKSLILAAIVIVARFLITVPVSYWGTMRASIVGTIFSNNDTAMALSFVTVVLLWEIFTGIRKTFASKTIGLILIAAFMFIVLMMGTKKGLIIFGIGAVSIYLYTSKNAIQSLGRIIVIGIAIVLAYYLLLNIPFVYEAIGKRIELMVGGFLGNDTDKSTATRMLFMQNAFSEFIQHPFLGIGQDGFRYVNRYQFTYSHNNYTELLANLGLIGFSIYYSLYVNIIKGAIQILRENVLPLIWIITLVVIDFSAVSYSSESKGIWLALIIGMIQLYKESSQYYDEVEDEKREKHVN